jgi:hypothetical protein
VWWDIRCAGGNFPSSACAMKGTFRLLQFAFLPHYPSSEGLSTLAFRSADAHNHSCVDKYIFHVSFTADDKPSIHHLRRYISRYSGCWETRFKILFLSRVSLLRFGCRSDGPVYLFLQQKQWQAAVQFFCLLKFMLDPELKYVMAERFTSLPSIG